MAESVRIQRGTGGGIRWTKKQQLDLKKSVVNFNRRVKAAEARGIDKSILPKPVKVEDVKKTIKTAKELRQILNILKKATAETLVPDITGIKTKWEVKIAATKRKSDVDLKREQIAGRISTERSLQRFPTERERLLRSIGIGEGDTGEERLGKIEEWLQGTNLTNSERWRQNYLKTIKMNSEIMRVNGVHSSAEQLDKLYEKIAQADLKDFLLGQLANPQQLAINTLLTSPTGRGATLAQMEDQSNAFETLIQTWEDYL